MHTGRSRAAQLVASMDLHARSMALAYLVGVLETVAEEPLALHGSLTPEAAASLLRLVEDRLAKYGAAKAPARAES